LLFTLIAQKQERYIIYWIPALTGLAAVGVVQGANFIIQSINRSRPVLLWLIALPIILTVFGSGSSPGAALTPTATTT
jgi:hypothetical protein